MRARDRTQRQLRRWLAPGRLATAIVLVAVVGAMSWSMIVPSFQGLAPRAAGDGRIPLAVLGDSDSHSYRDELVLPYPARGGEYRAVTYQWTDILNELRPAAIDQGPRGAWGTRRRYAVLLRLVGLDARVLTKNDFAFNMSLSGAQCADLDSGINQQLAPLLAYLRQDADTWADGVVVIRIGINDLLRDDQLEGHLAGELGADTDALIAACAGHVGNSVRAIRASSPEVAIVVSGLFDEMAGPPWVEQSRAPEQLERVRRIVDEFDRAMIDIAAQDPRVAFMDQRAWWRDLWGAHDPDTGVPQPKSVRLSAEIVVTNSRGDHPRNAVLEDGHAGTVVNAFWLNHLLAVMNTEFGLNVTPLEADEMVSLIDPQGSELWEAGR